MLTGAGELASQYENPSMASADFNGVTSRSRKTLAPVRYIYLLLLRYRLVESTEAHTYSLEDVTTRGSYYPDKSMATAAVSLILTKGYMSMSFRL
jgi:hypothetical protein